MDCSDPRLNGSTYVPREEGVVEKDIGASSADPPIGNTRGSTDFRAAQYLRKQKLNIRVNAPSGANVTEMLEMEALGRITLARELGAFGSWDGSPYKLKTSDRDRLLAQGRSDIAASYAILRTLLSEAAASRRRDRRMFFLLAASLAVNCALVLLLFLQ